MKKIKDRIANVIDVFHKTFGVGIYYFDEEVNLVYYGPETDVLQNALCLGLDRIHTFLQEQTHLTWKENNFYTYVLEHNLMCNIVPFTSDGQFSGAFVTQPVFLSKPNQEDIDHLLFQLNQCPHKHNNYLELLLNTPLIPYDKMKPMGEVLSALTNNMHEKKTMKQMMCGGTDKGKASVELFPLPESEDTYESNQKHGSYRTYLQLKDCIQRGDTETLLRLIDGLSPADMLMSQLIPENLIRSLKNSCIRLCSMCAFIAIETNASYDKMMNLCDEAIRKVESLKNVNDIYEQVKKVLFTYVRAVNVNHIVTFSKPVRLALEYIQTHYAEKITLAKLSAEIGLSASYLSTQMKKETGLSLMDNINQKRIEQSKKLLLGTKLSHLEIANLVGFHYGNHFASIFKKFTNLSPSEYLKTNAIQKGQSMDETHNDMFMTIIEQLRSILSMFPTLYDTARLIDPIQHQSWVLHPQNPNSMSGTCFDFWSRKESCANCISVKAYLENRPFFKTEHKNGQTFLVFAFPKTSESHTYVVEVLKDITDLL